MADLELETHSLRGYDSLQWLLTTPLDPLQTYHKINQHSDEHPAPSARPGLKLMCHGHDMAMLVAAWVHTQPLLSTMPKHEGWHALGSIVHVCGWQR
jgi:hypothetical protein